MKNLLNKFFVLAVLVLLPSLAHALIGTRNLDEETKHRQICMSGGGSTNSGNGYGNTIFRTSINGVSVPTSTAASAGAPSTWSWPAKLIVRTLDGSADTGSALTCTSATLVGTDQFGKPVTETLSTIAENETNLTTNVFSTLTSVSATGCANGADANDFFLVKQSLDVGLTLRIAAKSDVEAACINDSSDSNFAKCARFDNGGTDDIESAVNLSTHSIDLSAAVFGIEGSEVTMAATDPLCLRIRSSWRAN